MSAAAASTSSAPIPESSSGGSNKCVPQGPSPTRAYGVLIDWQCVCRWSAPRYQRVYGQDTSQMSPRDRDMAILKVHASTIRMLPHQVYLEFPNLPRLMRSVILMDEVKRTWLFVFKDDSSHEALHTHIDPEDVKAVKKFLGLEHQRAKWHRVSLI
ncbi:hypothetical protein C8T65DRAFT_828529 [Cerioporus squamosus]|nr:hypothetical protein C8T65DRAFT_828529 [Cerioporus squamosus]